MHWGAATAGMVKREGHVKGWQQEETDTTAVADGMAAALQTKAPPVHPVSGMDNTGTSLAWKASGGDVEMDEMQGAVRKTTRRGRECEAKSSSSRQGAQDMEARTDCITPVQSRRAQAPSARESLSVLHHLPLAFMHTSHAGHGQARDGAGHAPTGPVPACENDCFTLGLEASGCMPAGRCSRIISFAQS